MGFYKDLGTSIVDTIDGKTGYPKDQFGHLLDPFSAKDGQLVEGWDKPGTELFNLTSPYGFLEYAIGNEDDFVCFDYRIVSSFKGGKIFILHSVINSDTGGFIQDDEYIVKTCELYDYDDLGLIDGALEWCGMNDIKHNKTGWNQDPYYFHRGFYLDLMQEMSGYPAAEYSKADFSDRQLRFGGKRINHFTNIPHIK